MFFRVDTTKIQNHALSILLGSMLLCGSLSSGALAKDKADGEEEHVISLESTITGDKEQPAVSYFIPWKEIGTPDKLQWDMDAKHDDTLELVDRDVMLRSMQVYEQMDIEGTRATSESSAP